MENGMHTFLQANYPHNQEETLEPNELNISIFITPTEKEYTGKVTLRNLSELE